MHPSSWTRRDAGRTEEALTSKGYVRLFLLALPVISFDAWTWRYLQVYAPSNSLIRRVRSSPPSWRTVPALLALAAALLVAMHAVTQAFVRGAPGSLNLVLLVLAWATVKLGGLACLTAGAIPHRPFVGAFYVDRRAPSPSCAAGRRTCRTRMRENSNHAP